MVKILRKSVHYVRGYLTKYAWFLAMSYLTFSNELHYLWGYQAEVHQIFTRYSHVISAVSVHHTLQRLWKSVQRILRYFGSERTSPVPNKIGCHGNDPWDIEKNSDLLSTPKTLSYGVKIVKIARGLRFAYDTKLVAMATSLEESEKKWTGSRKLTQIPSIW